ncbi:hypothetical protein [Mitsuaria sp. GD03876]|uniref:hypothetical protein n=1 Tax=Mitsuaria sp. GD03876 TaxID=2975399 RepID=UPI002448B91D|nr:hypothetical protein [Mitsuaria sp. GD03876]MDH0866744.1 hypothetical protein [Mitsuaria sp. GD03876]
MKASTRIDIVRRSRRLSVTTLLAAAAIAGQAQPSGNLPVYTSPIDITGGRVLLRAIAPQRDSGQPVEIALPDALLGPKMGALLGKPLGPLFDNDWNTTVDPRSGMTPRQSACDGPDGIRERVARQVSEIGAGFSAYDIQCRLATTGMVLVRQVGATLYLSYQLPGNLVEFRATSPFTCRPGGGTPLCPTDPLLSVRFASEVWTVLRTPGLCAMTTEPGTVNLHAVQIDTHNAAGDIARNIVDPIFLGNKFPAAERAIQAASSRRSLPLDAAIAELRASPACADGASPGGRVLAAFSTLEVDIERQDLVLKAVHPAIAPPRFENVALPFGEATCRDGFVWREAWSGDTVCVTPDERRQAALDNAAAASRRTPGAYGPNTCRSGFVWRDGRSGDVVCVTPAQRTQTARQNALASGRRVLGNATPGFAPPSLQAPPIAVAGTAIEIGGRFFPASVDGTVLNLSFDRPATAACNGGGTDLEWAAAGAAPRVDRLPPSGNGSACAGRHALRPLTPATAYRLRARDCDPFTCSAWTPPLPLTTATGGAQGIALALDGNVALGTTTADGSGSFTATVRIPAGLAGGTHSLRATTAGAQASVPIEVAAANGAGNGNTRLLLTGSFYGDTGCPMRPLPDYAQKVGVEDTFPVFGSGFTPGAVSLHVDGPDGPSLGSTTARPDGSFCHLFRGPPASFIGRHQIAAVQAGAVKVRIPVEFTRRYTGPN